MKLIFAIVDQEDASTVAQNLARRGFSSTKLSTTGGFLLSSNVTLMIGVEDRMVQTVIDLIHTFSHSRKQAMPADSELNFGYYANSQVEVTVGGATIFVVDVDRFERV